MFCITGSRARRWSEGRAALGHVLLSNVLAQGLHAGSHALASLHPQATHVGADCAVRPLPAHRQFHREFMINEAGSLGDSHCGVGHLA